MGVSSRVSLLDERYADDDYDELSVPPAPGKTKHTQVRIYHALGVAFEIQDGEVTAVTLFPAAPPGP